VRVVAGAILSLVLFGLLAGSALSTHDPNAKYAGFWDIGDPTKGKPGKLTLKLVSEAEGRAAFDRDIVVMAPECRGVLPSKWYVGTFTTSNDHGPVAGCTDASFSGFGGYFKSTNFGGNTAGGKLGALRIPTPPSGRLLFHAEASAVGDFSLPIEYFDLPIRFAGHFKGDGSGEEKGCAAPPRLTAGVQPGREVQGECYFTVDFDFSQLRQPIKDDLSRIHTSGKGHFTLCCDDVLPIGRTLCASRSNDVSSSTIGHVHEQISEDDLVLRLKADFPACLKIVSPRSWIISLGVRVTHSNDKDCPARSTGKVEIRVGRPFPYVVLNVCEHREIYSPSKTLSKNPISTVHVHISLGSQTGTPA
jgi:hypothetical protein